MVRLTDLTWQDLRHRLTQGEVPTSAELAEALQRHGATGIPDDIRRVMAERLSKAPTPRRGRPKHTTEDQRKRDEWILSVYNRVTQLRARGMRRAEAAKAYADESGEKVEYVNDLLVNHAPRVRRKYPARAVSVGQWRQYEATDHAPVPESIRELFPPDQRPKA